MKTKVTPHNFGMSKIKHSDHSKYWHRYEATRILIRYQYLKWYNHFGKHAGHFLK